MATDGQVDLVRESIRNLLAKTPPPAVPERLLDNGFAELLAESAELAVPGLFGEQGSALRSSPALDLIAMHHLGLPLCANECVVYPDPPRRDRPGSGSAGEQLLVGGVVLNGWQRAELAIVPTVRGEHLVLSWIGLSDVDIEPVAGLDPDLRLGVVRGMATAQREREFGLDTWRRCVAGCQTALAHELVGVATATLELATTHVRDRNQFGKPLAARQSVRHRLADVYVAIAAAQALLDVPDFDLPVHYGRSVKALAGAAALLAAEHAQQVCGGLGFSREHALHRYVRRAHLLDALLGSAQWLRGELGRGLLADRWVPALFAL